MHLATLYKLIRDIGPQTVVLDPMDSMLQAGSLRDATATLVRLIDYLKTEGITAFFTNLIAGGAALEETGIEVSSLVDTWLLLRNTEHAGERNRLLYLLKSRGMAHSNQVREFLLTNDGIELRDVYTGPAGVLTGSARLAQEARDDAEALLRRQALASKQQELARKEEALQARVAALQKEFEAEAEDLRREINEARGREEVLVQDQRFMAESRKADGGANHDGT